jgi:hypothetical protein
MSFFFKSSRNKKTADDSVKTTTKEGQNFPNKVLALDCCCFHVLIPVELRQIISTYVGVPLDDTNIREAVKQWCSTDPAIREGALLTFGHIW